MPFFFRVYFRFRTEDVVRGCFLSTFFISKTVGNGASIKLLLSSPNIFSVPVPVKSSPSSPAEGSFTVTDREDGQNVRALLSLCARFAVPVLPETVDRGTPLMWHGEAGRRR